MNIISTLIDHAPDSVKNNKVIWYTITIAISLYTLVVGLNQVYILYKQYFVSDPQMINGLPLSIVKKLLEFPAFKTLKLKDNIICNNETNKETNNETNKKITSITFPQVMQKEINDAIQAESFLKSVCELLKTYDEKQQMALIKQASKTPNEN